MTIVSGYDGSRHAPTSDLASKVKKRGHTKEDVFAERLGDIKYVVKGRQKPDVIKEDLRYSIKGADKNIQLLLSKLNKSEQFYGSNNPVYKFQLAGYKHRKFKFENNDMVDTELFDAFFNAAENAANWLRNKNNFRFVIEKVFSDNYDANKLVGSLPLGWKQKLAFSTAIFYTPKIVFHDEPTGGVDPITRRQFWDMIYEAAHNGITVFVTTHYMDEAEYCDRVSIMVDGVINALDSPAGLKKQFNANSMDDVFLMLARQAKRGD